jgi:hypothetical protein
MGSTPLQRVGLSRAKPSGINLYVIYISNILLA